MAKKRTVPRPRQERVEKSFRNGRDALLYRTFLLVTAFLAGTAVMVLELAGNRILAPWFGNSLYTWTGLIGVVLVSLSCGYYLGGYIADKWPNYAVLSHLLMAAAFLTALIPLFQAGLEQSINPLNAVWGPVLATTLLLAAPGCLLAAVTPFAIKLFSGLSHDGQVGISAGSVGMSSTLGSVVGTFSAGFILIPHCPLRVIFLTTGAVLAGLALAGYLLFLPGFRRNPGGAVLLIAVYVAAETAAALAGGPSSRGLLHEQTTFYHRIRVLETPLADGDRLRTLQLDTTQEGGQFVRSREIPCEYQRFWELSRLLTPQLKRAAFLGGGAFAMPEALLDAFPEAQADVLEIDPEVIEVGRKYFRVDEYPRMHPIADDARRFLRSTSQQYELIVGDAYHGVRYIPAHLVTVEFFDLVKRRLTGRGVFMMNIISPAEGDEAALFQAISRTLREVFPYVYVFLLDPDQPSVAQNVILVAATHDLKMDSLAARERQQEGRLASLFQGYFRPREANAAEGVVLRDDLNPVEYLVARSLSVPEEPFEGRSAVRDR